MTIDLYISGSEADAIRLCYFERAWIEYLLSLNILEIKVSSIGMQLGVKEAYTFFVGQVNGLHFEEELEKLYMNLWNKWK